MEYIGLIENSLLYLVLNLNVKVIDQRGTTVDFLLGISAHNLVIFGFGGLAQKAKSYTYAC